MPRAEGLRCFDVFNVSGVDSNSHSTLSDRQPPLPGVTSHGTRGDWAHTGPFLSHRVALVTPPLQCHCITLARLVTHLPCDGRVSEIEPFCKSLCCAKTAHGIQSVLIPSDVQCTSSPTSVKGTLGFICHLHPPPLLQPSLIIFYAKQHKRSE